MYKKTYCTKSSSKLVDRLTFLKCTYRQINPKFYSMSAVKKLGGYKYLCAPFHLSIYLKSYISPCAKNYLIKTRMTTPLKAKRNKSEKQTNKQSSPILSILVLKER